MKYKSLYLSFMLAVSMLLAACSGNGGGNGSADQTQTTAAGSAAASASGQESQTDSSASADESSQSTSNKEPIYIDPVDSFEAMVDMTYQHGDIDELHFGNGETASLSITASPAGLGGEDFLIFDDSDLLVASPSEVKEEGNQTIITYTIEPALDVTASNGQSTLHIVPTYDIAVKEEADGTDQDSETDGLRTISYPVLVLDQQQGQVVYINESREAETGKVYHTDIVDAGEGCMRTTRYDAETNGYKPCTNCRQ